MSKHALTSILLILLFASISLVSAFVYSQQSHNVTQTIINLTTLSSGWHYCKSHVVNSQLGAGSGYQIRIVVHLGNGLDFGENVYLNGKCKADFSDIRFTGGDGATLLDHWMESFSVEEAIFWVRVTII